MKNKDLPTIEALKKEAKELRIEQPKITSHSAALNILAKSYGYRNWNTIRLKETVQTFVSSIDKNHLRKDRDFTTKELSSFKLLRLCFLKK